MMFPLNRTLVCVMIFFFLDEEILNIKRRRVFSALVPKNKKCAIIFREDLDNVYHVICKNSELSSSLPFPKNTTLLEFIGHNIPELKDPYFRNLTNVVDLRLFNNKIKVISSSALEGLNKLERISLAKNFIRKVEKDLFRHCPLLKDINLSENFIIKVESFAIATAHLIYLEKINFFSNVGLHTIGFEELNPLSNSSLMEINFHTCYLTNISEGAFSHLRNLKNLFLGASKLDEEQLTNAMTNISTTIENLSLSELKLQKVPTRALQLLIDSNIQRINLNENRFLRISNGDFPSLPNLLELLLKGCDIEFVDEYAFANLTSLQVLDISYNKLNAIPSSVYDISTLISLDLSSNRNLLKPTFSFGFKLNGFLKMQFLKSLKLDNLPIITLERGYLHGLINLKELYIRNSVRDINPFAFATLKNLKKLILSDNSIQNIDNDTFYELNELTYLALNRLNLNLDPNQLHFNHLTKLDVLDLSDNSFTSIPHRDIAHLKSLELLNLNTNNIVPWQEPVIAGKNLNLKYVLLRKNNLYSITSAMLNDFNVLHDIDVSTNPFNCSMCDVYQFAEWLNKTNTSVINKRDLVCKGPPNLADQLVYAIPNIPSCIIDSLPVIALVTSISVLVFIIIAGVGTCYYFRWYVRYYWFLTRVKVQQKDHVNRGDNFRYDAFISYNINDRDWITNNLLPKLEAEDPKLKLCLHERDFEIGKEIWSNIVESIDSSRKVVLLLSNNFLASQWCTWEMNMAQFKLVDDCRDALILILLEQINKKDMSSSLRYLVRTRTYLEWIENPQGQKLFWERLKHALQKPNMQLQQQDQHQTLV